MTRPHEAGPGGAVSRASLWALLAALVLAEIGYPLVEGTARAGLVTATVVLGYVASVTAAALTRGARTAVVLVLVTTGGGFAVEALGVATGVPFGSYAYGDALGLSLAGVPLIIPLAWTWMAWPAWLAAGRVVTGSRALRVLLAGVGLAGWDLFLDPQMVAEGYWHWDDPHPALPGVPDIPISNYLGWLVVAIVLMGLLSRFGGPAVHRDGPGDATPAGPGDAPMLALYLWTYASSVLAHAVFLDLPASAGWGALGMGVLAVPLAVRLVSDVRVRNRSGR